MHARSASPSRICLVLACVVVVSLGARAEAQRPRNAATHSRAELPGVLVGTLRRAGCRVPAPPTQLATDSTAAIPHVAYRAAILSATSDDWAVICERSARREVWIFSRPITAQSRPTARLSIAWDSADEGCEGWIAIADSTWVRSALAKWRLTRGHALTTPESSALPHAGIIDDMCGSGSAALWYWTGRRWVTLPAYWEAP